MAYFDCIVGGSGKGNTLVVSCADDLAGATITCTNGTKTYTKTCPSTAPYEVTFYGLAAGTYTVSATVSGDTYTTTVVITDYEAELGGFNWKTWVDLSENYTSSDFTDLDDLLSDETAIRELMTIHDCVDYLAGIAAESADVEKIIDNDLCAKWINNRDYALDTLYANEIIADYMDTADKYGYGEWCLMPQVPKMTSNTAPSGVASTSQIYAAGLEAYKAFDGDDNSCWQPTGDVTAAPNSWLCYKFTEKIKCIKAKFLHLANSRITSYKIQGSNDNNTWLDLTETIQTTYVADKVEETALFSKNVDKYQYYRLYVVTSTYAPMVYTLQLYAYAPKGNVPVMTANNAPYGEASATATIGSFAPYRAFDGVTALDSTSWSAGSTANAILYYKFTNPICPRRFLLLPQKSTGYSTSTKTWDIVGSNDGGSTWEVLYSGSNNDEFKEIVDNIENDNYYLYVGVRIKTSYRSDSYSVTELQFYGRELSVSVPVMTSNTAPFGKADGTALDNGDYYYAFNNGNNPARITSTGKLWYRFTNKVVAKMFTFMNPDDGTYDIPSNFYIIGSNDGENFERIATLSNVASAALYVGTFENATPYKYYGVEANGANNNYGGNFRITHLQFYGLDYSEKEFEEGSTKKWLYDHGVELEEITTFNTSSASVVKNSDSIVYSANGTSSDTTCAGFRTTNKINLSPYSLARLAVGKIVNIGTSILLEDNVQYYTGLSPEAAIILAANMLPRNISLDVSAVNQERYVQAAVYRNGLATEAVEMWLE